MTRLVTTADTRGGAGQVSVDLRHELELEDGARVLLLDDRGWGGGTWASTGVADVVTTSRTCVGPDEPFGDRTPQDMAASHWEALARTARRAGAAVTADALARLPHDVELTARLRARLR